MDEHHHFNASDGAAAMSIVESLLLALIDLKVISEQVAHDLLDDVISTHSAAAAVSPVPEKHLAVVTTVRRLLNGKGPTKIGE
jgi:hypothetical protein